MRSSIGRGRPETYPPHGWTATVPSGCSQVIVPLDVMVGCAGVPSLPIGIEIFSVAIRNAPERHARIGGILPICEPACMAW